MVPVVPVVVVVNQLKVILVVEEEAVVPQEYSILMKVDILSSQVAAVVQVVVHLILPVMMGEIQKLFLRWALLSL